MFWIFLAIFGGIMGAGNYASGVAQFYPPFAAMLARKGYRENPELLPQVQELITLYYKGVIQVDRYTELMREVGYTEEFSTQLLEGAQNLLNAYDYINLWRRKQIDENTLSTRLYSLGMSQQTQEELKLSTLYYPNPTDLVRMAVREVYTPEVVQEYGLKEDLPEPFLDASDKAGLSREFAVNFWAAHWELPAARQGYEMFQRRIINENELKLLLKNLDYMPYWRDKMIELQYNVPTRVDIRRLYKLQIYNREQVYEAYLNLGYKPEDAESLTKFTEIGYAPAGEDQPSVAGLVYNQFGDLVPGQKLILDSYKKGIIDRQEAESGLAGLGYKGQGLTLILDLIDEELKQDIIDIKADKEVDLYKRGIIGETDLRTRLSILGVKSRYIEVVLARELAQAEKRVRKATKTDLRDWLVKGIIDADDYRSRMQGLGYLDDDIDNYFAEILIDTAPKEEKEKVAMPTKTDLIRWYKDGTIDVEMFTEYMVALGYNATAINLFLTEVQEENENTGE